MISFSLNLYKETEFTNYLNIEKGDVIGSVAYYLNDILLEEIPLVADRTVEKSNPIIRMTDNLIFSLISTLRDN